MMTEINMSINLYGADDLKIKYQLQVSMMIKKLHINFWLAQE